MATNPHVHTSAALGQQLKAASIPMPTIVNRVAKQLRTLTTMPNSASRIALRGLLQMTTMTVFHVVRRTSMQTMQRTNASKRAAPGSLETLLRKTVSSVVATLRTLITTPTSASQNVLKVQLALSMNCVWR